MSCNKCSDITLGRHVAMTNMLKMSEAEPFNARLITLTLSAMPPVSYTKLYTTQSCNLVQSWPIS